MLMLIGSVVGGSGSGEEMISGEWRFGGEHEPCVSSRDSLVSSEWTGVISVRFSVLVVSAFSSVGVESEVDELEPEVGAVFRIWSRELEVDGNDVMSGDLVRSAAGKISSRKAQSPVTRMRLEFLSHSLHALALASIPMRMYLFAVGPTFYAFCLSSAKARQPNGFKRS